MKSILSICAILSSLLMLANCRCSSAKQSAKSTKSVTTRIEDCGLDLRKYKTLPIMANKTYTLKSNWDLKGETYILPEGVTLRSKGGVFKNGTLIGNNTKTDIKKALFDKVSIMGYWVVPNITTSMFASLDYENSLRDVLALTHPEIMNKVVLEDGDYSVSARSFQSALTLGSNVDLIIDGNIHLIPNDYKGCFVLQVKDAENVNISGKGCIYGDKHTHKGKVGEWGHGIYVVSSENVTIKDINVKDCWGDCIYVGLSSKDVVIDNCKLDNGRRQGISVTYADGVTIKNCVITNVYGTAPQYGIDLEPNRNCVVDNILIENVTISNCYGGIMSYRPEDASIGSITIKGCKVTGSKTHPIHMRLSDKIVVENCEVISSTDDCIVIESVSSLSASGNKMTSRSRNPFVTKRVKKEDVRNHTIIRK